MAYLWRSIVVLGLAMMVAETCEAQTDASLTCSQITDQVSAQNAIIKQKSQDRADLQNARPDPGAADPEIQERLAQIAADKATARASTLVALGRQKQCFK